MGVSDCGSRSNWGPQFAEVHVWLASQSTPTGILDTPGTMFDIDVQSYTPEQAYVTACGKHVHAGISGRGADLYALSVGGSSGMPEAAGRIASSPRLSVFPSPAVGPVTIEWRSDEVRPVQLTVHDIQGRLIADLGHLVPPGASSPVMWNRRDLTGRLTPPGIYLVRLSDQGRISTRRVVFVK